jgi:penicillin amidase
MAGRRTRELLGKILRLHAYARFASLLLGLILLASTLTLGQSAPQTAPSEALRQQARAALSQTSGRIGIAGLEAPVEVIRDPWGVAHIYATSQNDLFFAQGFVAAQDRLWQLDFWRRRAEGRLAEILGEKFVERDRYARLLRYRGDWDAEWRSYSPDAKQITEAFVRGINAYMASVKGRLPIEFQWLGIEPQPWTPETCVSRLAAYPMAGNAALEVVRAALVTRLGEARAARILPADPPRRLVAPGGLDLEGIDYSVVEGVEKAGSDSGIEPPEGSNNWVIAGARTATGKPILANDPHRSLRLPSLRYIVHLVAPGWNVIGAGEPALPAVSIGHNQWIAFGLTIFPADQMDIYVERTNPDDPDQYFEPSAHEHWPKMNIQHDEIRVRGEAQPRRVELKYTRHGPVIHEDRARHRAFALRWVGDEPGTAGYLGGLAISRAQNWAEFRRALEHWKLPPENFVYADVDGNIGYQAAGLVPVRKDWDGLLPVPGDAGKFEWSGFYGLDDLPHLFNPSEQFAATANNNTLPQGERRIIGFDWDVPFRVNRIREVLSAAHGLTVQDSAKLQGDTVSLAAREMLRYLDRVPTGNEKRTRAIELLQKWDANLGKDSSAAAVYGAWIGRLRQDLIIQQLPAELRDIADEVVAEPALLSVLNHAAKQNQQDAAEYQILGAALDEAIIQLEGKFGSDWNTWRWGALHTAFFRHTLATTPERAALLNRGPVERSGHGYTVNATAGTGFSQTSGASYRQVLDLADWDNSLVVNTPGQSGQPESAHYDDLLALWARDAHFPLLYSRSAVEKQAKEKLLLVPLKNHPK